MIMEWQFVDRKDRPKTVKTIFYLLDFNLYRVNM